MADSSVEQFVLEYTVRVEEAVKQIEKLQQQIERTNEAGGNSNTQLHKTFRTLSQRIKAIAGEDFPGLATGFGRINTIIKGTTASTALMTTALVTLVFALRQAQVASREFELNRITGFNTGNSALGVDQLLRRLGAANPRLNQAAGRNLLERVASVGQQAYTNPNPWNPAALHLGYAGTSAYDANGMIKTPQDMLKEISQRMNQVSSEQALAIGKQLGLTLDETVALKEYNNERAKSSDLTQTQIARMQAANEAADEYKLAQNNVTRNLSQSAIVIGQELLPVIAKFMQLVDEATEGLPQKLDTAFSAFEKFDNRFENIMNTVQDIRTAFDPSAYKKAINDADIKTETQRKNQIDAANRQKTAAELSYQSSQLMNRNVNMFAASVGIMSNSIDEQQAWAAWAGTVGQASGLQGLGAGIAGRAAASGGGNRRFVGGFSQDYTSNYGQFDSLIFQASQRVGVPADQLKAIIGAESGFNPRAYNPKSGAYGLGQVLPSNFKPGDDRNDIYTQILRSAEVLRWSMKKGGNDWNEVYRFYNGGSHRGSQENNEYPGRVREWYRRVNGSGAGVDGQYPPYTGDKTQGFVPDLPTSTGLHAETRNTAYRRMLINGIASMIGVNPTQVYQGQIPSSDIHWAMNQIQLGAMNSQAQAQAILQNKGNVLPQMAAAAQRQAINAANTLNAIKTYGTSIPGTGNIGDERQYTSGRFGVSDQQLQMMINMPVYVTDARSGNQFVAGVKGPLTDAMKQLGNNFNDRVSK